MRLPRRHTPIPSDQLVQCIQAMSRADVRAVIDKANARYLHWDEFRFRPMPEGVTPHVAWTLVKFQRASNRKSLPLKDAQGRAFSHSLPTAAHAVMHEVDRWGGGMLAVDGSASLEPMRDQIVVSSLMEEAIATSQIEGAATTRQVAKAMLRTKRRPRDKSEQMIVNSYATMQMLRENKTRPLSKEFIFEIQTAMTRGTLDDESGTGRYRTDADRVAIVDVRNNEVIFTPPPAPLLEERMQLLFDYANAPNDPENFTHPLIKAAILHFWLAYEHPFVDGNGRTARAIFYWFMLKNGYWLFEFLTVSRAIYESGTAYYRSFLHSETDEGDLTYSLLFQINATRKALDGLRRYLSTKQAQQRELSRALRAIPDLNHRQRSALDHALKHEGEAVTFQMHASTQDVTLVTARADILDLVRRGLLVEVGAGKQRLFVPSPDLVENARSS